MKIVASENCNRHTHTQNAIMKYIVSYFAAKEFKHILQSIPPVIFNGNTVIDISLFDLN